MNPNKHILLFLLAAAFLLRLFPLSFPVFTSSEARIAARGYTLTKYGTDELGRKLPFIFNSSEDYELPLTSYLTAAGIFIFGKNDAGARIPFILVGTVLVYFIYKLSETIFNKREINLFAGFITSFSPGLIFFSKFPNEYIISALLIAILLNILLSQKINKVIFLFIIFLMLITSKMFWFTLIPITLLPLFINKKINRSNKIFISVSTIILNLSIFALFIKIPQGMRSLIENNLSTVQDITIKNGIERLRSQKLTFWPSFLDKILFSKVHILIAAFSNQLSHFQLGILFGQLDKSANYGFLYTGAFPKIAVIPFLIGFSDILKNRKSELFFPLICIFLLTSPLLFVYPDLKIGYIILILPLIVLFISKGLEILNGKSFFKVKIIYLIIFFIIAEMMSNYLFIQSSIKNGTDSRPVWVKQLVLDGYNLSKDKEVYFSDRTISNLVPYIYWYAPIQIKPLFAEIKYPYKFYESKVSDIKIIDLQVNHLTCNYDKYAYTFAVKKDVEKLNEFPETLTIKNYQDDSGKQVLTLTRVLCK